MTISSDMRDALDGAQARIHAAIAYLRDQIEAKGLRVGALHCERKYDDEWQFWISLDSDAFRDSRGCHRSSTIVREKRLADAFAKMAAKIDAIVPRDAYAAWFSTDQPTEQDAGAGAIPPAAGSGLPLADATAAGSFSHPPEASSPSADGSGGAGVGRHSPSPAAAASGPAMGEPVDCGWRG